ncbi:phosphoribosylamine--glycine ligase [Candidatus Woesearchaeota archaeon]|nr:phosphoribosylamine--glycine ligase [Candidatus Woesearchaeota archaeon]
MTNILLVGNGAREHAIAETIMKNDKARLFSYMKSKNPGIAKISEDFHLGSYDNLEEIKNFAKANNIEFVFVGPEDPLHNGVVDALNEINIPCVGPSKNLARLETSKSFTRLLLKKYNIDGNPKFEVFESLDGIEEFLEELDGIVIKPDGLTGGKGVKVQGDHFQTKEDALAYCEEVLKSHPSVVVEEKLEGEEFSLQCLTDGKTVAATPPVQDHKRRFAGDKGPNTGGMGSYSDSNHLLPFMTQKDMDDAMAITQKVAEAIYKETGEYYKGVMYGGFIITKGGLKLIEYNARFGDPEAMNTLPLLKTDFVDICKAIVEGTLADMNIELEKKATVCKYAVPKGYGLSKDDPLNQGESGKVEIGDVGNAKIYYAAVDEKEDGIYMTSSRAIGVVGIADTLEEAEKTAENAVNEIKGNVDHRPDIGTKELVEKRVRHMQRILK